MISITRCNHKFRPHVVLFQCQRYDVTPILRRRPSRRRLPVGWCFRISSGSDKYVEVERHL